MHELCYATSDRPDGGFRYGGVLVSNNDLHIGGYKESETPAYYGGNNHGSLVEIGGRFFVFYHRHTHGDLLPAGLRGTDRRLADGSFVRAEMTSQGLSGKPLAGRGNIPRMACNLWCAVPSSIPPGPRRGQSLSHHSGRQGRGRVDGYIANMMDGAVAGFKSSTSRALVRSHERPGLLPRLLRDFNVARRSCGRDTRSRLYERMDRIPFGLSVPDGTHPLYFRYEGRSGRVRVLLS